MGWEEKNHLTQTETKGSKLKTHSGYTHETATFGGGDTEKEW